MLEKERQRKNYYIKRKATSLETSDFKINLNYDNTNILYVFSSKLYLNKFRSYLLNDEEKNIFDKKIYKILGFNSNFKIFYDLNKYREIEKKGYLIYFNDKKIVRSEDLKVHFSFN